MLRLLHLISSLVCNWNVNQNFCMARTEQGEVCRAAGVADCCLPEDGSEDGLMRRWMSGPRVNSRLHRGVVEE